jgi:hypothetical protein
MVSCRGDADDSALAGHLVAVLFAAAGPMSSEDAARLLDVSIERLHDICGRLDREPPVGLALQHF